MQETHPHLSRDAHMPFSASPALVPADSLTVESHSAVISERLIWIRDPFINNMLNICGLD